MTSLSVGGWWNFGSSSALKPGTTATYVSSYEFTQSTISASAIKSIGSIVPNVP
jgi:hypothetical protein